MEVAKLVLLVICWKVRLSAGICAFRACGTPQLPLSFPGPSQGLEITAIWALFFPGDIFAFSPHNLEYGLLNGHICPQMP